MRSKLCEATGQSILLCKITSSRFFSSRKTAFGVRTSLRSLVTPFLRGAQILNFSRKLGIHPTRQWGGLCPLLRSKSDEQVRSTSKTENCVPMIMTERTGKLLYQFNALGGDFYDQR